MKKYHIIYKTTCLVNGRYYIGCHATDELNDGYLGSGVELLRDVYRYGKSAFVRETLYECGSREEAALKEREVVNREVVDDQNSYNQQIGGSVCGVKIGISEESLELNRERKRERYQNDPAFRERENKRINECKREKYQSDPIYRERQNKRVVEYIRIRYQNDPDFRARQLENNRKQYRKRRFKEKLTTSTDFCLAFVLRCKSDATLLQRTLELFKRDLDFCELLKALVENE